MALLDSRSILERIMGNFGLKNDEQLADFLNKPISTLRNWRHRNNLPIDILLDVAEKYNLSTDWLIYGKEQEQKLSDLQRLVLKAFDGLEEGAKLEALAMMGQLGKGTPLTGNISQTAGDSGMNNVAGGDINMNKDTAQSAGDDEVKPKKRRIGVHLI